VIALQELRHALDYLCALLVVAATPLGAEEQKQTASARSGPIDEAVFLRRPLFLPNKQNASAPDLPFPGRVARCHVYAKSLTSYGQTESPSRSWGQLKDVADTLACGGEKKQLRIVVPHTLAY
jgi:hypothetical protein